MTQLVERLPLLKHAAQTVLTPSPEPPSPASVVEALLECEKAAKKSKQPYEFKELIGTWRLCFITGTKKTRQRAGIVMGSGRYLPRWVKIQLSYSPTTASEVPAETEAIAGQMHNFVQFGSLQLALTGPAKFIPGKNILAFDFTRLMVKCFGIKFYDGFIRGGEQSEANFYGKPVKNQAFFAYFLVAPEAIAARGRGGGLALWAKVND